jgi:hypothetical protein
MVAAVKVAADTEGMVAVVKVEAAMVQLAARVECSAVELEGAATALGRLVVGSMVEVAMALALMEAQEDVVEEVVEALEAAQAAEMVAGSMGMATWAGSLGWAKREAEKVAVATAVEVMATGNMGEIVAEGRVVLVALPAGTASLAAAAMELVVAVAVAATKEAEAYSAMVGVAVAEAVQEAWVETAEVVAVKEVKAETGVRSRRKVIPRTPRKVCHISRHHPRTDELSTF